MKQGIRIFFLILSLISGGIISYEIISETNSFITLLIALPCFIICSLVAIFITTKTKLKYIPKRLGGFIVWISSLIILTCIIYAHNKIRNLSPVVISTKFFSEEGLDIDFRKNGAFKALSQDMFSAKISYGRYILKDKLIILKDKVQFGMENLSDTLFINEKGIAFNMEKPWRVNSGLLRYKYIQKTNIEILNNTDFKIDSLSIIPNTSNNIRAVTVDPKETKRYKFRMKNEGFLVDYNMTYKINNQFNSHKRIMNGYPLEMVKTIEFNENHVTLNLISGYTIKLNHF